MTGSHQKSKFVSFLLKTLVYLGILALSWFIYTLIGLIIVFIIMDRTRGNPAYNLEMGWMAVIILVPMASVFLAILTVGLLMLIKWYVSKRKKRLSDTKGHDE